MTLYFVTGIASITAAADCFFEDGRVGGNAPNTVFVDEFLQFAGVHDFPVNEIEPDRLAGVV